ncbi:MAG: hypothetical protein ACXVW1_05405 [Nocardioides sp.]
MRRILVALTALAACLSLAAPAATAAPDSTPAQGYYSWSTTYRTGGLREGVDFKVKADGTAQILLLQRICRGDHWYSYQFSGRDRAKGNVPIVDGVLRKSQSFTVRGDRFTLSVHVGFDTPTTATGWLRLVGPGCTGAERTFHLHRSQ